MIDKGFQFVTVGSDIRYITAGAKKDVEKLRKVVEELYVIARNADADIARLGEERIIVTPTNVKIWKPDYDLK